MACKAENDTEFMKILQSLQLMRVLSGVIFTLALSSVLFGCSYSNTVEEQQNSYTKDVGKEQKEENDTFPSVSVNKPGKFSESFIKALKELIGSGQYELRDSMLIIDKKDTSYFPGTPAIGQNQTYTGKKGDLSVAIHIQRLNYTTIKYRIEIVEHGKSSHYESGEADLNAGFFLGSEIDEDDLTGNSYPAAEFSFTASEKCFTIIRIGFDYGKGMAKLNKSCNGKLQSITLENFPTLRLK
jgi:hypothetical protein